MIDRPLYLMKPEDEAGGGGVEAPAPTTIVTPSETFPGEETPSAPVQSPEESPTSPEAAPADEPTAAAWLDKSSNYNIDIDGQVESLTGQQYDYLAQQGYQALQAAAIAREEAGKADVKAPEEADQNDPMTHISALKDAMARLTGEHQDTKISIEQTRLTNIVDTLAKNSPVAKVLSSEGATEDVTAMKEEAYSLAARRGINVDKAWGQVEGRYERMATRANKNYIEGKLEAMAGAAPSGGGKAKSPEKPLTHAEMKKDPNAAIKRTMEMLSP